MNIGEILNEELVRAAAHAETHGMKPFTERELEIMAVAGSAVIKTLQRLEEIKQRELQEILESVFRGASTPERRDPPS